MIKELSRWSKKHLMNMMKLWQLGIHIQRLITACSKSPDSNLHKKASKQLSRLKARLPPVNDSIASVSSETDNTCLLEQHEEQLSEFKKELSDVRNSLLSLDLEDEDEVFQPQSAVEKTIFDCSLKINSFIHELVLHRPRQTLRVSSSPNSLSSPLMETSLAGKRSGSNFASLFMTDPLFLTQKSLFTFNMHSRTAPPNVSLKGSLGLASIMPKRLKA